MFDQPFPFLDSDVYKWLEAVGWELGRGGDPDLAAAVVADIYWFSFIFLTFAIAHYLRWKKGDAQP